jgi:hypothetical protein
VVSDALAFLANERMLVGTQHMSNAGKQQSLLQNNGLLVPCDFPTAAYESVHNVIAQKCAAHALYEQYVGAWNALAYRFRSSVDYGDAVVASLMAHGTAPKAEERYRQERALFGFFSSGFSTMESTFYGLFAIGAFITPTAFPLTTPKEQQQVSPKRTTEAFTNAFAGDPILQAFATLFADPSFQRWREIRNVLTHRTAPGRRLYVSFGDEDVPATEWKLTNAPLDANLISTYRTDLARVLGDLLAASSKFVANQLL